MKTKKENLSQTSLTNPIVADKSAKKAHYQACQLASAGDLYTMKCIQETAKNYHDRTVQSGTIAGGQVCGCCGKDTIRTISIEHDSQDYSKDLSVCTDCCAEIYKIWKEETPKKICPI